MFLESQKIPSELLHSVGHNQNALKSIDVRLTLHLSFDECAQPAGIYSNSSGHIAVSLRCRL